MKLNWFEEIKRIDPDIKFRAQGGWLKTVEKLDKTVKKRIFTCWRLCKSRRL